MSYIIKFKGTISKNGENGRLIFTNSNETSSASSVPENASSNTTSNTSS